MNIVYFIDNKLGGITSLNYNLIDNAAGDAKQLVINIDQDEWAYTRANIRFHADKEIFFNFSAKENAYSLINRLFKLVPPGPGAIILNDSLEMQMLDHFAVEQTTYQLVHDEYNFTLAVQYGHVVDVFIAHSLFFYEKLIVNFPDRAAQIFFLPHGVAVPAVFRTMHSQNGPIRLLFLGRMTKTKGIFDLPEIDRYLDEWNVPHTWTCIGNGPELQVLKEVWKKDLSLLQFLSPPGNAEVMELCAQQDVFVLPTQFEGSPVSLLETMSVGLVPVISDLPGGIREIVHPGIGYRIPMGDTKAFATAVRELDNNRELLQERSIACRKKINNEFNVKNTAATYHRLFAQYREFYRPKQLKKLKIGSRLDQPWMPSIITSTLRSL